ncbi:aldehyde dehydrogenase (NADP(+)) [Pseudoflavitalea sp. G-6-1-2]|uniref:aldehyde dehydrogenase (NADP(+)) n=1 Tax=Pseudoflavitalea sp. G-6-1-2 TaxID=2728841 RepID=UPI00146CEE28|nr:aldehyde dehydrogenase (NADP(+)) [Pseudoflavitalea sp. G-6-1-2]NML23950.1 aldehyde dehydrogenase (NADP(+)) [Pseudoflavitalea sp. G-6-1-2]
MPYADVSLEAIDTICNNAWESFHSYRLLSLKARANFMRAIAKKLDNAEASLLQTAMAETHLPEARLRSEKARTVFQLTSYADACERGNWLDARIDTAKTDKNTSQPDIRKTLTPLGPVVVFGASNFPFAYSTAGGDTACALAAGCPVIVKGHPAHAETSEMVAQLILEAARETNMPSNVFAHVHGSSNEVGKALVTHPRVKAVGFTGSYGGGKALWDWANARPEPIPVFAEMGSINPVFLFPEKLQQSAEEIAKMYAASVTTSVGQFCTNPGLIIGIESDALNRFIEILGEGIAATPPATMLHPGIAKAYTEKRKTALSQRDVTEVAESRSAAANAEGIATIATAPASAFLNNPVLHQEVFGPYSIVIRCQDADQMRLLTSKLEGQLTASLMATDNDLLQNPALLESIKNIAGRFIMNGVPTGVTVCLSMQHGGPFPATTDPRFTAVGADGIKRFARPVAYQNWSDVLLPDELKRANPLGIWRTVNDQLTKDAG